MIVNQAEVGKVRENLVREGGEEEAVSGLQHMLEIKRALLSRADIGLCCAQGSRLSEFLSREVLLLEETLGVVEKGDRAKADSLLAEYLDLLATNYRQDGDDVYCRL
ncbi:MAG: hypothetical protein V1737_05355 [Chloroflexota bacterium]